MNRNIAGTPNIVVTLCAAMSASARPGIEGAVKDDERALLERRQHRDVEPADMEDRRGDERHVVGQHVERVHAARVVPPDVAMGEHRALRAGRWFRWCT